MSVHESWLNSVRSYQSELLTKTGLDLVLPPSSLEELKLEYILIEAGTKMRARLPFQKRFTNPMGLFQGGFLSAAIDEVMGPLSYLSAKVPCMTISMNVTFIRPFQEKMGHCLIEAKILRRTANLIFLRAEVESPEGDLLAHAESVVTVMREDQIAKASE